MPLIKNEQEIKKESNYLKLESGSNKVILKSNAYTLYTYYLKDEKKSILAEKKISSIENKGIKRRQEFHYWAVVNGNEGAIRLPGSVFFELVENEKELEKDKRLFEWKIKKAGEGLDTEYTVVRGGDVTIAAEEIDKANELLAQAMVSYERKLKDNLESYLLLETPKTEVEEDNEELNSLLDSVDSKNK